MEMTDFPELMALTGQTEQTDRAETSVVTVTWAVVQAEILLQVFPVVMVEMALPKAILWYYGLPGILMQEKDLMLIPVSPETEPVQEQAVQADKGIPMLCLHRFAFS